MAYSHDHLFRPQLETLLSSHVFLFDHQEELKPKNNFFVSGYPF